MLPKPRRSLTNEVVNLTKRKSFKYVYYDGVRHNDYIVICKTGLALVPGNPRIENNCSNDVRRGDGVMNRMTESTVRRDNEKELSKDVQDNLCFRDRFGL